MKKQQEEQRATLAVRRVIQLVRGAREENFETLKAQLDDVLENELPNCGSQQQRIKDEADKGIEQAKAHIEQVKQLEEQRRIAAEKAEVLLKELEGFVVEAEAKCKAVKDEAQAFAEDKEMALDGIVAVAGKVEEAVNATKEKLRVCGDFITARGPEMKVTISPPSQAPTEDKLTLQKLLTRINEATHENEVTLKDAVEKKAKAVKQIVARKFVEAQDQLFDKFDADKDGLLSKAEAQSFAKTQYEFALSAEACDLILSVHAEEGSKGISKAKFQRLKNAVGIAREKAKDAERKEAREKRERELAEAKERLQEKVASAVTQVAEFEVLAIKADETASPLLPKAGGMTVTEMEKLSEEVDEIVKQAKESLAELKKTISGITEGVDKQLSLWLAGELRPINAKMMPLEPRLNKSVMLAAKFREQAGQKKMEELDALEAEVLRHVRHHQKDGDLKSDELYDLMDSKKDGKVDEEEFLKFFTVCKAAPKDGKEDEAKSEDGGALPPPEELARLFKYLDEGKEGSVPKERMIQWLKVYMKVNKETVLTSDMSITTGEIVRRLDVGESIEVLTAPEKETSAEVWRVRGIAMKDMAEGYVTVKGSAGTPFLMEGGHRFKVVKETILTATLGLDGGDSGESPKKLKVGEIVEVREWPKKEEASGLTRMKCRVKTDGSVGWATTLNDQGTKFLEVL